MAPFTGTGTKTLLGHRRDGRPIWLIQGGAADEELRLPDGEAELAAYLHGLGDDEVEELEQRYTAEFDRINDPATPVTAESLDYGRKLTKDIDSLKVEIAARAAKRTEAAERAQAAMLDEQARLRARVHGPEGDPPAGPPAAAQVDPEAIAAAAARGTTDAILALMDEGARRRIAGGAVTVRDRPHAPLSAAQALAPRQSSGGTGTVTASVNVPGRAAGEPLSFDDMVAAFQKTAKQVRTTHDGSGHETVVATIENRYPHILDDRSSPAQVEALMRELLTAENQQALVAGGGWCSPSENRYEFFNIVCSDGMVDLPTFGVSRGGLRFPVSPSIADAVYLITGTAAGALANQNLPPFGTTMSSATVPWLWTETDDTATVTGNPNKPALRIPCPSFSEQRLECYGVTVTAGNLTDDAYPEATANTIRLVNAAHDHAINARYIAAMLALSSSAITISGSANRPVYNQVLSGLAMAATDYRMKFGMCLDDVLECVLPQWVPAWISADLAYRVYEAEFISQTRAQIEGYFRDRNIRVQWVNDWQVRGGAGQFGNPAALPGGAVTAWPTTVDAMLYAAGTFIRGNGLTLDLGVIRDSVLNAENDHTAVFTEECHLIARLGHESRRYTIAAAVNGAGTAAQTAGAYI